jgi:hypothetical protein
MFRLIQTSFFIFLININYVIGAGVAEPDISNAILKPTSVIVYKIDPNSVNKKEGEKGYIGKYKIKSNKYNLNKNQIEKIKKLILISLGHTKLIKYDETMVDKPVLKSYGC